MQALLMAISEKFEVVYVCRWPTLPVGLSGPYEVLSGDAAEDLYLALTGHMYGEEPGTADLGLAYETREMIRLNGRRLYGEARRQARLAGKVIEKWGDKITPWLHVTKIERERIVADAPEYYKEMGPVMIKIGGLSASREIMWQGG